jgi:HK97 family phage major capsid protein
MKLLENPRYKKALENYERLNTELNTLLAKGGEYTDEETARMLELDEQVEAALSEVTLFKNVENIAAKAAERTALLNEPTTQARHAADPSAGGTAMGDFPARSKTVIPATVRRINPTNFKSDEDCPAVIKAYRFGQWFLGAVCGQEKARQFCRDHGILIKAHTENVNTSGGYIVPDEFENDLIDLRERYGLFRQWAKRTGMKSDTKSVPRRTGGLVAYFVGEGQTITDSTKGWDRVGLTARKLAVLSKYSSELDEDAVIEIGNDLAGEISYAFALKEDQCGFLGDGTSTYGGIVGVKTKLLVATASLSPASGNLWSEIVLSDFNNLVALLPEYADTPNCAWYCHKKFYHAVMERLMLASGGVTASEIAAGRNEKIFMGYPVRISQVMPNADANSSIPVYFGDLALAARFGDRRLTTLAISEHLNFAEDEIAIRGTERFDINVHDVGDTSTPGPLVGLQMASS